MIDLRDIPGLRTTQCYLLPRMGDLSLPGCWLHTEMVSLSVVMSLVIVMCCPLTKQSVGDFIILLYFIINGSKIYTEQRYTYNRGISCCLLTLPRQYQMLKPRPQHAVAALTYLS